MPTQMITIALLAFAHIACAASEQMQDTSDASTQPSSTGRVEIAESFNGFSPEGLSGESVDL
ncbi:MAG: hypothetical protein MK095_10860, partial [Phycisphaerales bacterium]|nr:hypothetical protein [Phycisphaerales bacterium]